MGLDRWPPVAQLVVDALQEDGPDVMAVVERDGAAAVVVVGRDVRRTVIVQRRDGEWHVPPLVGGMSPIQGAERAQMTTASRAFLHHHVTQSGWPEADGSRPAVAWQAVTGYAADDAIAVIVTTEHDLFEADVDRDGFFLTLTEASWGVEPTVRVRTATGRLVDVQL